MVVLAPRVPFGLDGLGVCVMRVESAGGGVSHDSGR
jgi:hypothetical protein